MITRRWHTTNRAAPGFTLIELVVVIVILGILAAVALPRFVTFAREARIAAPGGSDVAQCYFLYTSPTVQGNPPDFATVATTGC